MRRSPATARLTCVASGHEDALATTHPPGARRPGHMPATHCRPRGRGRGRGLARLASTMAMAAHPGWWGRAKKQRGKRKGFLPAGKTHHAPHAAHTGRRKRQVDPSACCCVNASPPLVVSKERMWKPQPRQAGHICHRCVRSLTRLHTHTHRQALAGAARESEPGLLRAGALQSTAQQSAPRPPEALLRDRQLSIAQATAH